MAYNDTCIRVAFITLLVAMLSTNLLAHAQYLDSTDVDDVVPSGHPGWYPVIDRVTGCEDQETTTIDCGRTVHLTLHGSGFQTGLEYEGHETFDVRFANDILHGSYNDCMVRYVPPFNDTYVECICGYLGYGVVPTGQILSISLISRYFNTTLTVPAFSLKVEPVVIGGVRGCSTSSKDGMTAYGCDLVNDRITLVGSGFNFIYGNEAFLTLGSQTKLCDLLDVNPFIRSYNDTEIALSFVDNIDMLSLSAQNGELQLLTFSLKNGFWKSEPVYVQFVNLPKPNMTAVTRITNSNECEPIVESNFSKLCKCRRDFVLRITGSFIYAQSKFFIGNVEIPNHSIFIANGHARIGFPALENDTILSNISVVTPAGTTIWPVEIEFVLQPFIVHITPCMKFSYQSKSRHSDDIRCIPGEKHIHVAHIRNTTLPRVYLSLSHNITVECKDAVMVNDHSLYCTMPPRVSTEHVDGSAHAHVEFASGEKTCKEDVTHLWEDDTRPVIRLVSGCRSKYRDPLHLAECSTRGTIITISGARLNQPQWTFRINPSQQHDDMVPVTVHDDSTLICVLPPLNELHGLVANRAYEVYMLANSTGPDSNIVVQSNSFYLTFVEHESSNSSDLLVSLTDIFTIPIVCIIAFIALARAFLLSCAR